MVPATRSVARVKVAPNSGRNTAAAATTIQYPREIGR